MYTAMNLSKYIVSKCIADGHPISNLQLQKILYYIQRNFLKRGKNAFCDDIEAWKFGPVVPNVYYHYCGYGSMLITIPCSYDEVDKEDRKAIDSIVEEKRDLKPWELVEDTHKENSAWAQTYKNGLGYRNVISNKLIKAAE